MGNRLTAAKLAVVALACLAAIQAPAQTRKDFKFSAAPGATLTIVNESGAVTVRAWAGRQVAIAATTYSDKVEIDQNQSGTRIEVRTHLLQPKLDTDQSRVDYEISVPPDVALNIRSSNGPIAAERMRGDINLEGDTAQIDVRESGYGHVHVRTMGGPVRLVNVANAHVEITSVSGNVELTNVDGPRVEVNTTNGKIAYSGDFGREGDYTFTSHSGDIDVTLPASASVDITARSVKGSVQNDFPFQPKQHTSFAANTRAFAGTSNSGSSSVQLRSFSGTIRVKKQ
ncbi:MAG TPA: DUF4097 family beta strand repeat-containing protein [Clostridia bacterium]|nr:DUF4097 family beta strand repeat-containing protein [Clostridia bacterium]